MSCVINKLTRETLAQCLRAAAIYRRNGDYAAARRYLEWARQDLRSLKVWGWKLP